MLWLPLGLQRSAEAHRYDRSNLEQVGHPWLDNKIIEFNAAKVWLPGIVQGVRRMMHRDRSLV